MDNFDKIFKNGGCMNSEELEKEVFNEYDYSNIVPEVEPITYLVRYCDTVYNQLLDMMKQEEKKNEKLKSEYRFYEYKKNYNTKFEVVIRKKSKEYTSLNNVECDSYNKFMEAVNDGHLKNVDSLVIKLNLSYKKGKDYELTNYDNSFKISMNPYDIKLIRKSNHAEDIMNQIENTLNDILKKFKTQDSIFCSK